MRVDRSKHSLRDHSWACRYQARHNNQSDKVDKLFKAPSLWNIEIPMKFDNIFADLCCIHVYLCSKRGKPDWNCKCRKKDAGLSLHYISVEEVINFVFRNLFNSSSKAYQALSILQRLYSTYEVVLTADWIRYTTTWCDSARGVIMSISSLHVSNSTHLTVIVAYRGSHYRVVRPYRGPLLRGALLVGSLKISRRVSVRLPSMYHITYDMLPIAAHLVKELWMIGLGLKMLEGHWIHVSLKPELYELGIEMPIDRCGVSAIGESISGPSYLHSSRVGRFGKFLTDLWASSELTLKTCATYCGKSCVYNTIKSHSTLKHPLASEHPTRAEVVE